MFLDVFVRYNTALWPAQIVLNAVAVACVALCFRAAVPSRFISTLLALLWIWTGLVYHILFFSTINPAAFIFGGMSICQGLLFLLEGSFRGRIAFGGPSGVRGTVGALCILYALLIYPVLGYALGHAYPAAPTFGAPCPTTIFTFGMFLWSVVRIRWYMVIMPFLWSLLGSSAAWTLGMREDFGLLIAGLAGTALLFVRPSPALVDTGQRKR
jgi:hypothetical protein